MKRCAFILLAASVLILSSCEKEPDTGKLDNNYLVYTNYDAKADFKAIDYFYVIDSILIINDSAKPTYWNNDNSQRIVTEFANGLQDAGYERVLDSEIADVVLQLSYVSNTYYFNDYGGGPWWNSYPGYWNWGGWGWYYPYSFIYSYSTGSIIGELVSTTPTNADKSKLPVIWNTYICGLLNGNTLSLSRTMEAIEQAFEQSTYLNKQ